MSCDVEIELPGLTEALARELRRRVDLAGMPFDFYLSRRPGRFTRGRTPRRVAFNDLESDPSVASESLDHPEGWPQDHRVREWLARAIQFLGESAPEGRFTFCAGWHDRPRLPTIETDLTSFLSTISAGAMRADQPYAVWAVQRPI